MFAAALAYGMKISRENIEHGLRTFTTSFFQAPGRLNVFDEHPFKVIMDYAHNAAGVHAMASLTDQLNVLGKRIVVLAAPGDRRDEDVIELAQAAAGHYDTYLCKRDDHTRGRRGNEVPELLRKGLVDAGVHPDQVEIIEDEQEAIVSGLSRARPGDLVVVFADNIPRSWKQIIYFKPELQAASEKPSLTSLASPVMTTLGGLGHALPYLIPDFWTATTIAVIVVFVELWAIAWIQNRLMETPFLHAAFQVVLGGGLVFAAGVLIGGG